MVYLNRLCHRYCAVRYAGGFLELRKLDFRGLKGQFDFKKAKFRGLVAKIGLLRLILTFRTHLWLIFMDFAMGIVP